MFQTGGIELVTTIDSNHPKSELEDHRVSIIEEFTKRPPASAKEASERIFHLTGIRRSVERVRGFVVQRFTQYCIERNSYETFVFDQFVCRVGFNRVRVDPNR